MNINATDHTKYTAFTLEEQIIHHLMLQTVSLKRNGLLYGKSGIALAFFEYGKYQHNSVFIDYANELMDSVFAKVNNEIASDFATGLCGFGWCVEYLMQHRFINCDYNAMCIGIDKQIMANDVRRIDDLSFETGIEGLLHYVMIRLGGTKKRKHNNPFDAIYLKDVYEKLQALSGDSISDDLKKLKMSFISYMETGMYLYELNVCFFTESLQLDKEEDILSAKLGLSNGLAGKLIRLIYHL